MSKNTLELIIKAQDYASKELKKINKEVLKITKSAKASWKAITKWGADNKEAFKKMAIWVWVWIVAIWVMWKKFLDLSTSIQLTEKKANIVFWKYIDDVRAVWKETASAMWLSQNEYLKASAWLQDLLIPMWFARKEATKMTTDMMWLAWALSEWSAWKYTAVETSEIMAKAMLWETEQLKTLWIQIDQSSKQFNDRIKVVAKDKDITLAQAKALDIQKQIFEKSTDAQKAYAEWAWSLAREQAILTAKLSDTKDSMAKALIPAFVILLTELKPVIDNVTKLTTEWFENEKNVEKLTKTIGTVVSAFGFVFSAIWKVIWFLVKMGEMLGFIAFKVVEFVWVVKEKFKDFKEDTREVFEKVWEKLTEFWEKFGTAIEVIVWVITGLYIPTLIKMSVATIVNAGKSVVAWATMKTQALLTAGTIAKKSIPSMILAVWKYAIATISTAFKTWIAWVSMWAKSLIQAWRVALAWIIAFWPIAWVSALVVGLAVLVYKNWDKIILKAKELKEKMSNLWKHIYDVWFKIWQDIHTKVQDIRQWFVDLVDWAKEWGINLVTMIWDWIADWVKYIKEKVVAVASTIKNFLWFWSPTKEWPWKDSNRWIPNLITMLVKWFREWEAEISEATVKVASAMSEWFWKGMDLNDVQNVMDSLKEKFQDSFGVLTDELSTSNDKIKTLKGELASLWNKLKDIKAQISDVRDTRASDLAQRVIDIEKELQVTDISNIEEKKLKEELAYASSKTSIEEIQKLKDYQALTESEQIVYNAKLQKNALEEQKANIRVEIEAKKIAISEEQDVNLALYQNKVAYEQAFQTLFMTNANERALKLQESIDLMNKLNAWISWSVSWIDWARATWWPVSSWGTYLVWEKWPELFTPKSSWSITPNNQLWGWVTINMGGVVVQNEADENRLIEKLKKALTMEARNYNLWIS